MLPRLLLLTAILAAAPGKSQPPELMPQKRGETARDRVTTLIEQVSEKVRRTFRVPVTLRRLGAKGDGITDDSDAIEKIMSQAPANAVIDGEGRTYKIVREITRNADLTLRNCRFVFGQTHQETGCFTFKCDKVIIENVRVDGGRGTYKTGLETWTAVGGQGAHGLTRIEPLTNGSGFFIKYRPSSSRAARLSIRNCSFENMFITGIVHAFTYGEAFIRNCTFKNYARQDVFIWHSLDQGTTRVGRTFMAKIQCEDQGILPDNFTVDGVAATYAASVYCPTQAYGLGVAYGEGNWSDISFTNYCTTGLTAEQCGVVNMKGIHVYSTSDRLFSNNPSGAIWLERCQRANLSDIGIYIFARDARDYAGPAGDSSALFLFGHDDVARFSVSNVTIKTNAGVKVVSKSLRIIGNGNNTFDLANVFITGTTDNSISAVKGNGTVVSGALNFANVNAGDATGSVITYGFADVNFTKATFASEFFARKASDFSLTGSARSLRLNRVSTTTLRVTEDYTNAIDLSAVSAPTNCILPAASTGHVILRDCKLLTVTHPRDRGHLH